jgi:calcium-dependent protein kinase
VLKVIEVFIALDTIHIVTELCDGGELFDRLFDAPDGRFTEPRARAVAIEMVRGLRYLHANGIVHRDLKLENFLFPSKKSDKGIKLIDFGYSRTYLEGQRMTDLVGTTFYMAPEVCKLKFDRQAVVDDLKAADMWGLGVCMYMLVTGEIPIFHNDERQLMKQISDHVGRSNPNYGGTANMVSGISTHCQKFVSALIEPSPQTRLSSEGAMNHEWLTTTGTKGSKKGAANATAVADATKASVARRIADYRGFSELKRLVLTLTAFHFTPDKIQELNDMFAKIDVDGNGLIEYSEFHNALAAQLKADGKGSVNIKKSFNAVDFDATTKISYTEFTAACLEEKEIQNRDHVIQAFRCIDSNNDGQITKDELRAALPPDVDDAVIDRIIADADFDGDGAISEEEFAQAMKGGMVPVYTGEDGGDIKTAAQAAPGLAPSTKAERKVSQRAMKARSNRPTGK